MDFFNIPDWAKRYGAIGLIIFIVATLLAVILEAILEQEIQSFWNSNLKPLLTYKIQIDFSLPFWVLVLMLLLVSVTVVIYFNNNYTDNTVKLFT